MANVTGNPPKIKSLLDDMMPEPTAEQDEWLDAVRDFRSLFLMSRAGLHHAAATAYEEGCTYEEIGEAMGLSSPKDGAWRFINGRNRLSATNPDQMDLFQ